MTTPYVDPDTIAVIGALDPVPSGWFGTVRDGLEFAVRRPGCVVRRTTTQSIGNNTLTALAFTAADLWDTDGFHDTSTNPEKIIVPAGLGGLYRLGAVVPFAQHSTGARVARLRINGSTNVASVDVPTAGGSVNTSLQVDALFPLNAGDEIEVIVFQNSGGPLNVNASSLPCMAWAQLESVA